MKTLSKILDTYTNITKDTKKFVELHAIKKTEDANGNDDKLFNASNINLHDREKNRHGYNPEKDKAQYDQVTAPSMKEEVVLEKLKPSMGMGKYITDFQASDAPQFAGKSKEERRKMAIAAYLQASGKSKNEEIDYNVLSDVEIKEMFDTMTEEEQLTEAYALVLQALYESLDEEGKAGMEAMLEDDNATDELMSLVEEILKSGENINE